MYVIWQQEVPYHMFCVRGTILGWIGIFKITTHTRPVSLSFSWDSDNGWCGGCGGSFWEVEILSLKQKLFVNTVFSTDDAVLDAKKDFVPNHTRSHQVGYICTSFVPRRLHATIPMLSASRRRHFWWWRWRPVQLANTTSVSCCKLIHYLFPEGAPRYFAALTPIATIKAGTTCTLFLNSSHVISLVRMLRIHYM